MDRPGIVRGRALNASLLNPLHDLVCGGVAAAGCAVLFNVCFRALPWCAASGALALAVRAVALGFGCSFEASSFMAALALSLAVQLFPSSIGVSHNVLAIVGCIPMIPGGFAARAFLGLFSITLPQPSAAGNEALITALTYSLRVIFTIGALGTGLAIPTLLLRLRGTNSSQS
jgi:uncharacterized membrane protein YjjB (DUF3815 family)